MLQQNDIEWWAVTETWPDDDWAAEQARKRIRDSSRLLLAFIGFATLVVLACVVWWVKYT